MGGAPKVTYNPVSAGLTPGALESLLESRDMKRVDDIRQLNSSGRIRLFDEDGLPWTSRLHWGVLLFWVAAILFVVAPLVGIYLGIWLISKGRSAQSFFLYLR